MKEWIKKLVQLSMFFVVLLVLASCTMEENTAGEADVVLADDVIVITDINFGTQVENIQWNREQYLGRTIRYEGMFFSMHWQDEVVYVIAREEGDGCCGGIHGFEVYLNNFASFDDETWVEVTGILEEFYVDDAEHPFIRLNVVALEAR